MYYVRTLDRLNNALALRNDHEDHCKGKQCVKNPPPLLPGTLRIRTVKMHSVSRQSFL